MLQLFRKWFHLRAAQLVMGLVVGLGMTFGVTSLIISLAFALPVSFSRGYRNNAWGYQNYGCFVDEQRYVYTYDESKADPFKVVNRLATPEFVKGLVLLRELATLPFVHGSGAVDAGVLTWSGYNEGEAILLKKAGDIQMKRDSPRLTELIDLINSWCQQSHLPTLPE